MSTHILYGEIRQTRSRPRQRLFYQLPQRLAFSLADVAPPSALAAGHIFMGFTKCGQFVLSYTHSCDTDDHTLQVIHRYRLHWWLFVPYAPLKKVAEVMLFGDQDLQESLYENFYISLCQWPRDLSKILVYGCSMFEGTDGTSSSQTRRCYITITAVPSLDNCSACYQVATSYEEEDLAERWNSCVRFSCLKHGITVHTSFEMVPPFPKFLPNVQMKRKGFVVLNAGNFIHVLNVDLENMDRKIKDVEAEILGVRLNRMRNEEERENERADEDSDDERKNRGVSGNLRSGKEYRMIDSSNSDVDPGQSSCEEEENREETRKTRGGASGGSGASGASGVGASGISGLKITLNSGTKLMTDKDREWEILIGNVSTGERTNAKSEMGSSAGTSRNFDAIRRFSDSLNIETRQNSDNFETLRQNNENFETLKQTSDNFDTIRQNNEIRKQHIDNFETLLRQNSDNFDNLRQNSENKSQSNPRDEQGSQITEPGSSRNIESCDNKNCNKNTDTVPTIAQNIARNSEGDGSQAGISRNSGVRNKTSDIAPNTAQNIARNSEGDGSQASIPKNSGCRNKTSDIAPNIAQNTAQNIARKIEGDGNSGCRNKTSDIAQNIARNSEGDCAGISRNETDNSDRAERVDRADRAERVTYKPSDALQHITRNLTLKEFQLPDDSPYHMSDSLEDSDDSTRHSHVSEDSRYDLRGVTPVGPRLDHSSPQRPPRPERRLLRSSSDSSSGEKTPTKQAEKEYEFIDEITDGHEKLSVFRRRRLADKKYEFSDENMENIPQNYSSYRSQSRRLLMSPSRSPRFRSMAVPLSIEMGESSGLLRSVYEKLLSPSSSSGSPNDVLRPINQNITSPILSPREDRWREEIDRLEKAELQRWSSRESLGLYTLSPGCVQKSDKTSNIACNPESLNLSCVVDFHRRYIEVDDELVSIITDIEDDELGTATGYHNALPLEVHGSGYTQMHMISNSKAEKLMAPGVLVRQVSLDVEQFCHEMAHKLCTEAGKKYFFCNDYNVEIVDVCPSSGDIVALASVLVQAATVVKGLGKSVRSPITSLTRRQYRTTATFVLNMDTKQYYIVDKEPLLEEDPYSLENMDGSEIGEERWWVGARQTARQLRTQWSCPTDYYSSVKVITNESLLKGKSLSHIMEGQHLVALVLWSQQHTV